MFRFRLILRALPVAALLGLAACASVDSPTLPRDVPAAWRESGTALAGTAAPDLRNWWKAFGDARLNGLVDQALAQNLDVAQAASRLRQARLVAGQSNVAYLPMLSAGTRSVQIPSATDTYLQASLDAVWELGLFGAREGVQKSVQGLMDAAEVDAQSARVSVVAEVVRSYLDLRAAQNQIAVLQKIVALDERTVQLIDVRIDTRLASAGERDVVLARKAHTLAEFADPQEAQARAAQGLAVLLGKVEPDPSWFVPAPQPELGAVSIQQLPADLLLTRPEIRKAEAMVEQAAGDLGVARSELYPRIALGASYLASYNITQNSRARLNTALAMGPIIDVPIFDWGRRKANADAHREALTASVLAYRQSILQGLAEVESALASLNRQGERLSHLQDARDITARSQASQQTLARLGLSSEFDTIPVARAALQTDLDLTLTRVRRGLAFVALYKSLGGAPLPANPALAQAQP